MNQQEAERALEAWASIERDDLVRAAHIAGVSKARIHTITGIARTTIDRILDSSMARIQAGKLAAYLTRSTADWPRPGFPSFRFPKPTATEAYTVKKLADILLADPEFKALRLGTFLNAPDGNLTAEAVEALAPPLYPEDITLLAQALQQAACKQHQQAKEAVAATVLLVAGAAVLIAAGNS